MAFGLGYGSPVTLLQEARRMVPSLSRGMAFSYILELRSGAFYVGCSVDYETRFREHQAGTACRTTALDPPVALRLVELHADFTAARRREAQLKKWSRAKKEALIAGDFARLKELSRSR